MGDRYLTAVEASQMLDVSTTMAHRALKHLADNQLLVRRRNCGTFVGPRAGAKRATKIRAVYVLMPAEGKDTSRVRSDLLMEGIRNQLDNVNVQFSFIPAHDALEYVRELVRFASSGGELAGIVPISCPREVYRHLAEAGVPSVVLGSLYLGDPTIPSVDTDNHETGRLLCRRLVDDGHRRIGLLTSLSGRPGDNDFFDGVSEVLTSVGLPHNALVMRIVPPDVETFPVAARHLLEMADRPSAVITRCQHMADAVARAASDLGLSVPEDVEIVFEDLSIAQIEPSPYPHVRSRLQPKQIGTLVGGMLKRLVEGQALDKQRVVTPVELCKQEVPMARAS